MVYRDFVSKCLLQDAITCLYGRLGTRLGRWMIMRFAISVGLYVPVKHSAHDNSIEPNGRQRWPSIDTDVSDRIHGGLGSRTAVVLTGSSEVLFLRVPVAQPAPATRASARCPGFGRRPKSHYLHMIPGDYRFPEKFPPIYKI